MLLKKINAILGLLITFLLLDHAIFVAVWMFSKGGIANTANFIPRLLTALTAAHAFISLDVAISGIVNGVGHKCNKYPKLNITAIIQRVSGVLLVIFIGLHIAGATGFLQPPPFVHATVPVLFFTVAMLHMAFSASRALITLGIGNAKFIKVADIVIKVVCGATLIADIVGFYLYLA